MELKEALQSRTSVRRYKTAPSVGNDIIQELVELGMRAPNTLIFTILFINDII